jgi:GTP-binding protein
LDENTSAVVLVNKWDAIVKDSYTMIEYSKLVRHKLNFMDYVPILFISALTGQRVGKVLSTALEVRATRFERIPTSELNRLVRRAAATHAPPSKWGKRLKFFYTTQAAVDPPVFVFFVNDPRLAHFSYQRYLENKIREAYPFVGTPIILKFRPRGEED